MEKKFKFLIIVIITLSIIGVLIINSVFFGPEYATAFEMKEKADIIASEWAEDAALDRLHSAGDMDNTGRSTLWSFVYYSPSSILQNDGRYNITYIALWTNGKIQQTNSTTGPLWTKTLNITIDSDEACAIALSDPEFKAFLDYIDEDGPGAMASQSHWEPQAWHISAGKMYGIDGDHNWGHIYVNSTTGEIESKDIMMEGNSGKYICFLLPVIIVIIIIATIIKFFNWVYKGIKEQRAIRSEQGGFPEEIGPAEERKGGR